MVTQKSSISIPKPSELLKDFARRHNLTPNDLLEGELVAVRAIASADLWVSAGYVGLDDVALQDPAVGMLLNMFSRNRELVEGAVAAFVTECGQAAEVASRAAVESSVNLAYIAAGVPKDRLRAYFEHYFDANDRQLKAWIVEIGTLPESDRRIQERGIDKRRRSNDGLRAFFDDMMGRPIEPWPRSIEHRFKALNDTLSYRTFYARMSSEVHGDAEETIRYFIGKLQEPQVFEAMALETIWTTRLYIHYAVSCFLRAGAMYASRYAMNDTVTSLRQETDAVQAELMNIASHLDADGTIRGSDQI